MFLWLISWVAVLGELCFAVLSIAAGLYYLAELIEEYSVIAKRVITYMTISVIVILILLFVIDGFPVSITTCAILCHLLYGSLLRTYPEIKMLSIGFLGGSVCLIISHLLAFSYFSEEYYSFQEIVAFFFICQWTVPFSLFISLTANDLVLPTLQSDDSGGNTTRRKHPRRSGFLSLFDFLSEKVTEITPSNSSKRL